MNWLDCTVEELGVRIPPSIREKTARKADKLLNDSAFQKIEISRNVGTSKINKKIKCSLFQR